MADQAKLLARARPLLKRIPDHVRSSMAEIGLFAGDLAEFLLERRPLLAHYGVDNWVGTEQQPEAYKVTGDVHAAMTQARQDSLHRQTLQRLERYALRSIIYRMASLEVVGFFEDACLDLVFIDADHSYEGCLADCRAWWPKVKPGGLLSGHDYLNNDRRFNFGVNRAVNEFVAEVELPVAPDGGTTWFITKPCA